MHTELDYYLNILKLYRQFSEFKELSRFSTNIRNTKKEKIIFHVILETNEYGEQYYNIIFNKETNISATCNYISKEYQNNLLRLNNHIVYYFRANRKTDRDDEIIEARLKPKRKFKIESLLKVISQNLVADIYDTELFIAPNAFVFPNIRKHDKDVNEEFLEYDNFKDFNTIFLNNWFEEKESSILVIKGEGGVGKTTMAKYFGNHFLNTNPHTSKIFIDSHEAKDFLLNNGNKRGAIELYDLYSASYNGNKFLESSIFKHNLDAGNFFIIIDGIDELISKVPNFDIKYFLNSITKSYSVINNTKILITCRSYFWDLEKSNQYTIDSIEVKPFSLYQTKYFFNICFSGDKNKSDQALELADNFHRNKIKAENFHPYALDIISRIVGTNKSIITDNQGSFSELLNPNETLDCIVDRICNRENFLQDKVRILDLTVNEQICVFKTIATKYNGHISTDLLKKCISKSISKGNKKNIPHSLVEAFKTHLLVSVNNSNILSFKYDFLTDFFKSIYIANYFNLELGEETISSELIDLFKVSTFGSGLAKEVTRRIVNWSEDELTKLSDLVDQIRKDEIEDKDLALSGVFNIAFYINKKFKSNTTIDNTDLIKALFGPTGHLKNLCLKNIFDNKYKIKFDFSGMYLEDCIFYNYVNFWDCTFDNEVYFTNCVLKKLGKKLSKDEIPFDSDSNVDKNCKTDESFNGTFVKINQITEEYRKNVSVFIKNFLKFFITRGTLWPRNYNDDQGKYETFTNEYPSFGSLNIDLSDFISIVKELKLIEIKYSKKFSVDKIQICSDYKFEVLKYLDDETHSEIIGSLKEKLLNYVR